MRLMLASTTPFSQIAARYKVSRATIYWVAPRSASVSEPQADARVTESHKQDRS